MPNLATQYIATVRQEMFASFNLEALRELCFILGIDVEDLPGNRTKTNIIFQITSHMALEGRLENLATALRNNRPAANWPSDIPSSENQKETAFKETLLLVKERLLADDYKHVKMLSRNALEAEPDHAFANLLLAIGILEGREADQVPDEAYRQIESHLRLAANNSSVASLANNVLGYLLHDRFWRHSRISESFPSRDDMKRNVSMGRLSDDDRIILQKVSVSKMAVTFFQEPMPPELPKTKAFTPISPPPVDSESLAYSQFQPALVVGEEGWATPPDLPSAPVAHTSTLDAFQVDQKTTHFEKFLFEPDNSYQDYVAQYPTDFWDYLRAYPEDFPQIPSHADREKIKMLPGVDVDKRLAIWNFFFRVESVEVGQTIRREIENLQAIRANKEEAFRNLQLLTEKDKGSLITRLFKISGAIIVFSTFLSIVFGLVSESFPIVFLFSILLCNFVLIPLGIVLGTLTYILESGASRSEIRKQIEVLDQGYIDTRKSGWLVAYIRNISSYVVADSLNYVLSDLLQTDYTIQEPTYVERQPFSLRRLWKSIRNREVGSAREELQKVELLYQQQMQRLSEREMFLNSRLGILCQSAEMIKRPSDDQVQIWFAKDLEKQEAECRQLAAVTLEGLAVEGEVIQYSKVFINPAELQEPEQVPMPYRPDYAAMLLQKDQTILKTAVSNLASSVIDSRNISSRLAPKPLPDLAKHLLSRREVIVNEKYSIIFAVSNVDYLFISADMMILHSFFFDFINGQKISEKVTEIYFENIVALERRNEYRVIPVGYGANEVIEIENAPAFSLSLPSGETYTLTFINEDYLHSIAGWEHEEDKALAALKDAYVKHETKEQLGNADETMNILRSRIRLHMQTQ